MITIEHVSKTYKKGAWALLDVSVTLGKGMTGLLGPNGAGKTTLMRILAGLAAPTSGHVTVAGIPLTRPDEIRQMIGYLPQYFHIYPQMTGREYLDYVGVMKGMSDLKARRLDIARLLEMVNMQDKADKKVRTYSGGMKQRIGIAQSLMGSPEVLIVDEPTSGLDPRERVRFRNMLTRFSLKRTVLLSTHIVADIESNCRQVAVLNQGSLLMTGDLQDLQGCGQGYVWEAMLSAEQYHALDPSLVMSSRQQEGMMICRMISMHKPHPDALQVEPGLEEGYIALLRRERDE
ncbi:ABC transporter ATP-binding protein [Paenibacillus lemnae]|uniref:ABC transporter ATP-binding protein n=1 Tax=Paenibacillus lemnae TaxID=1330551 RepID=A0A848MB76_PAELE|nr:ABC transporter ATP-binding protein [Paenibacillus lemnae]NMO97243.1 ABC transporter ATP-binding protein [Paenibacillus lemnae]